MKIYLMGSKKYPQDADILKLLKSSSSYSFENLELPKTHDKIGEIFKNKESGVVFLPAVWADLYSVKVIQELSILSLPYETVMVGTLPETENLIVAFNEGLGGYIQTPISKEQFEMVFSRVKLRYRKKCEQIEVSGSLDELKDISIPFLRSKAMMIRDNKLGRAFIDLKNNTGSLCDGEVSVLIVGSSFSQHKKLIKAMEQIGISCVEKDTIKDTLAECMERPHQIIISDCILKDGDVIELVASLWQNIKGMPHIIAWSSSPEKASELLKPENHIDEFILKPGPDIGVEFILPSIISAAYRNIF